MTGAKTKRPGFTLLEMLLVVLIFSMASVILSQTYIQITRLQRKVSNMAVLSQDMRFATELIVRTARNNYIDYSSQPLPLKSNDLLLDTPDGKTIEITTSADCHDTTITQCLKLKDVDDTWNPLTSHRVNVKNFDVYVRPQSDPFADTSINQQPMVTVNIGLEYKAADARDSVTLQVQTAVSSRLYRR